MTISTDSIRVRGARQHNLRNLDVDIPRDRLVVITGLSGSGKSSLAYDTIFAEGQRRYIESLSAFARQYLEELERPDVDLIEGLPPTITVAQDTTSANPRSIVATVTEIYDYLRLLYARLGTAHCWQCGQEVGKQSADQIVETALQLNDGQKLMVLAPIIRGRKGQHREVMAKILRDGFVRARIDTTLCDLNYQPELHRNKAHTIEAVIDRIVVRSGVRPRLSESVQLALRYGEGTVILTHLDEDGWHDRVFSTRYACMTCDLSFDELAPRSFSFNSPYGACEDCSGLGIRMELDPDLVIPDLGLSIENGAVAAVMSIRGWRRSEFRYEVELIARKAGVSLEKPLSAQKPEKVEALILGNSKTPGVIAMLQRELSEGDDDKLKLSLTPYLSQSTCRGCNGARLRVESRGVTIGGKSIHEVSALSIEAAHLFLKQLKFPDHLTDVSFPILNGIEKRLDFLTRVGLGYLTLDRSSSTLSGGEGQRIRLAAHIGSGVVGVCYVLDEPTIGLHQRDNARLIEALKALRDAGNSVLVIEHDEEMMLASDFLVDLGPGAGVEGGRLVAADKVQNIIKNDESLTGRYLSGSETVDIPAQRRSPTRASHITIKGVKTNNLKNVTVKFPIGLLIAVTGVSGSGKSSLVTQTLAPVLRNALSKNPGSLRGVDYREIQGVEQIDRLIEIDQSPIGRSPRSTPATYTSVFDQIRRVFAETREAKARGYKPGRFSSNVKSGRCETCDGLGFRKVEMNFLPDMLVPCDTCRGRRFNPATLEVTFRGRSISDVLEMTVNEAVEFFDSFSIITRQLTMLRDVGLGYLTLGQSSITLSGGEAQRVKLASELARVATGRTFYVLDEPTTGLHFADVDKLLAILNRLVSVGNTVLVIEHQMDVIKMADWVIDLGPEAGDLGGNIVAAGIPETIVAEPQSHTGRFLADYL